MAVFCFFTLLLFQQFLAYDATDGHRYLEFRRFRRILFRAARTAHEQVSSENQIAITFVHSLYVVNQLMRKEKDKKLREEKLRKVEAWLNRIG